MTGGDHLAQLDVARALAPMDDPVTPESFTSKLRFSSQTPR